MAMSERIQRIVHAAAIVGKHSPLAHYDKDFHMAATQWYGHLPLSEKIARAEAYALCNQEIFIDADDGIIGRNFLNNEEDVPIVDPELEFTRRFEGQPDCYDQYLACHLVTNAERGHVTWGWEKILRMGVCGLLEQCQNALACAVDEEAAAFYRGVMLVWQAAIEWNAKHIQRLKEMGKIAEATVCERVPMYPARNFREAVQSFFFQHLVVMRENPFGGNGPGRLDYYLWPYLEQDLEQGRITMEEAEECIFELFIRIDERIHIHDGWVEAIVVGGSYANGSSSVNPLTYMMVNVIMQLNLTHPSVYIRLPHDAPEDLLDLCARYFLHGANRAQILNDDAIIPALTRTGVSYRDAVEYACGGCMEIAIQGTTSDFAYIGWYHLPKMVELALTGGKCMVTGQTFPGLPFKGLRAHDTFEGFYQEFLRGAENCIRLSLAAIDALSAQQARHRPSYLISSLIDDCLSRGKNMHGGGARHHDYGVTPMGFPNAADYLYAIKAAVFDEKLCTPQELTAALAKNFAGHEWLQNKLLALPKYGQEHAGADEMMCRLVKDIADIHGRLRTRWGGRFRMVVLTFVYGPEAGYWMGATADGHFAGRTMAQAVTPQVTSMTEGLTVAMNSALTLPFELFDGGATTMWDLDPSWASENIAKAILKTFLQGGGQIFQGNAIDIETLRLAQQNPEDYRHLIVRVGGYSARFTTLSAQLQRDIMERAQMAQR